jgi:hypothetical protein
MALVTGKLPPITSRDVEHLQHADQNIARRGGQPKRASDPIPVHPGMLVKQLAGMNAGGLSHPLDNIPDASSSNPLDPTTPPKNLTPVKIAFGMRSRTTPGLDDAAHLELGRRILDEAAQKVRSK